MNMPDGLSKHERRMLRREQRKENRETQERHEKKDRSKKNALWIGLGVLVVLVIAVAVMFFPAPTGNPVSSSLSMAALVDDDPFKGDPDAPVVLVEFSDFQCPFCNRVNPTIEKVQEKYGDQVRIVFKHILSNLAAPILVIATVEIARAIATRWRWPPESWSGMRPP